MAYVFGALCSSTFETLIGIFISKVVSKEERATQFGNSGALGDLGRVSISALTVLLITIPSIGWINAARLNATITLTYSIFIFIFFKYNIPIRDASVKLDTNFKQILSNTKLVLVTITSSFDTFASLSLYIFIPYLLMGKGFSVGESGLMNTLFFVGYMLGRLGVSRLSKHFGLKKTFIITELIMGALIFTLLLVDNPIIISIIIVLLGVTTRGTSPILKAMLSHSINEKHSLEDSMAFYQVCGNATTMIGRLIFGAVANSFGVISVFGVIITSVALSIVPISKYEDDD
jgi:predicted MFS family arabinose efflux permease